MKLGYYFLFQTNFYNLSYSLLRNHYQRKKIILIKLKLVSLLQHVGIRVKRTICTIFYMVLC